MSSSSSSAHDKSIQFTSTSETSSNSMAAAVAPPLASVPGPSGIRQTTIDAPYPSSTSMPSPAESAILAATSSSYSKNRPTSNRPNSLRTPLSATFPSTLHSPNYQSLNTPASASFFRSHSDLKTPLTPPSAYLDFLNKVSPSVGSPLHTGTSSHFSFSAQSPAVAAGYNSFARGHNRARSSENALYPTRSAMLPPTSVPHSARPTSRPQPLQRLDETSRDNTPQSTPQAVPTRISSSVIPQEQQDPANHPRANISRPMVTRTNSSTSESERRRPSLIIPPSPTTRSPMLMSPSSVRSPNSIASPASLRSPSALPSAGAVQSPGGLSAPASAVDAMAQSGMTPLNSTHAGNLSANPWSAMPLSALSAMGGRSPFTPNGTQKVTVRYHVKRTITRTYVRIDVKGKAKETVVRDEKGRETVIKREALDHSKSMNSNAPDADFSDGVGSSDISSSTGSDEEDDSKSEDEDGDETITDIQQAPRSSSESPGSEGKRKVQIADVPRGKRRRVDDASAGDVDAHDSGEKTDKKVTFSDAV